MVAGAGDGTGGERALVDLLAQSISSGSSRAKLVAAFVGSAGANLCFLLLPLQIPLVVSALDDPHSSSNKDLLRGCARMVGLYLFRVVLGHGGRHLLNEVGEEALLGIQQRLFSAAQRLKVESFELEFGLGKILPLLEHDAPAIRDVLTINLERVVMGSFYVCGGIYLCLAISTFLTLVVFAAVVPIAASSMLLKRVSERFGRRLSDRRSRLAERSRLVLGSTRLVRSHACEELELARYKELGREYAAEASAQSVFMSACKGGSGLTHSFALMAIIFFGVRKASASDGLRSGELVALVNIVVEIGKHLDMAVNNYLLLSTAAGKALKCQEVLQAAKAADSSGGSDAPGPICSLEPASTSSGPVLELRRCTYAYDDGEGKTKGVREISFSCAPGELLCLVGPSGCGKSTALDLVSKFRPCQGGQVLIHGRDLAAVPDGVCRSWVSWVGQSSAIVPGTVRENIAYGLPLATDEDVMEAVRLSSCDDFIDEKVLDQTFDEGTGFNLSGGQRARVAIARGLLKVLKGSASVLLLDEVTANLDPLSEASLLSGIRKVTKRHRVATLFVTHRISNAKIADKVLVVKSGAVIERGTHDQLCDMEGGVYQKLLAASDSF